MSSSHQSKFPCIIITIIIILLFFSSFSTLLTVNLFVLFWRCFVMLNSYFVCFIIYIFFFNFEIFFVDIIFVPKIGVCFSFYPVSLIFEYEAKPHIRWPHIREYEAGESGANFTSVVYVGFICTNRQSFSKKPQQFWSQLIKKALISSCGSFAVRDNMWAIGRLKDIF